VYSAASIPWLTVPSTRSDELARYSFVDINTADGLHTSGYSWDSDYSLHFYSGPFLRIAYEVSRDFNSTGRNYIATIPTIFSALLLLANSPLNREAGNNDRPYITRAKSTNARWTTETSQPVVIVKCSLPQSAKDFDNMYYIRDDDSQSPLSDAANLLGPYLSKYANRIDANVSTIPLLWMTSPDISKNLLVVYLLPPEAGWLEICTVAAFWQRTSTTMVLLNSDATIQTRPLSQGEHLAKSNMTEIVIDSSFMSSLGLPCTPSNSGDVHHLALCFASALSWIPASLRLASGALGIEYEVYKGYNRSELDASSILSTYELVETIDGYGYGATDTSIRLAVAVMLTYCIITVVYVSYMIITGHTSIAWDSATELIMLALQSKEPAGLGHVSVGLDSMETFRKGVGIRVSTLDKDSTGHPVEKLELVFEDDEVAEERGLLKIERGKAY
jgi:hypothetical protein